MASAHIAAASMVKFGKYPRQSAAQLGRQALMTLLADSNVNPDDIEAAYFARAFSAPLDGQVAVAGQTALNGTGIDDIPVFNIDNACAACPTALNLAAQAVQSGRHDLVLVVGMDKLYAPERKASMRALFGAMDVDAMAWLGEAMANDEASGSIFMDTYYARIARRYLADTDAKIADFAKVAVKNRSHAKANPFAQYRTPLTEQEVLTSPMVADPLRTLMCSPLTDGAAAMLVCSERFRAKLDAPAIRIRASVIRSGKPVRDDAPPVLTRASQQAYDEAGIEPADLDLIEVHDASAVAELIAIEELGLVAPGDAVKPLREGASTIGGKQPVNASGGLLSRGHPGAATGASQLVELVWQLQGRAGARQVENARLGLAHSSGGVIGEEPGATAVTILDRV
jgi:acetyl-CoA acetyltransferase